MPCSRRLSVAYGPGCAIFCFFIGPIGPNRIEGYNMCNHPNCFKHKEYCKTDPAASMSNFVPCAVTGSRRLQNLL